MLLTPHILLGAAIGSKISSPSLVFALSFASHYFLDALPHYEYDISGLKKKKAEKKLLFEFLKLTADFCFGAGLALLLVWNSPFRTGAILGMLSSLVPDALLFLSWRHPNSKFLKFFALPHRACHFLKNLSPAWLDLSTEVVVASTTIFFLVYYV
ncbi:MAG: hypothetical protein AUJ32_03295 [Parcubacteria group bacterium CG1_02_40_82]|uniref:Uncharacterized protein n=4 Tax=Candidatus Portnoyibacteriota TaxID=1817913 RepID=A0A2M7IJE7_9BACT|nr:MAG: hypothetical protein AUJ32_03295 [Parcubacteria group bacterium CG1_02_40_82]PIQ75205.1 MAG: hypothetical protein COV84_02550 [Candidatus Portnoybacteria bacterium CG11_big_fil_rev_8_21_14_0_20_40_15]PIS31427.1 MAG: hypothetical protein COT41_01695 [Candidatus Portnoybacteria bacterium CG08_land_8_20_14_0_20_40_83]PIW76660.1 MAG: hypothetical protein CO001_00150 [Candidatus Portnoybacteria bacterium CG_4_8_14_3_um_filter_40_10]PIY75221.1 MAG: hypothetical protein COY85_00780 [Candidatus